MAEHGQIPEIDAATAAGSAIRFGEQPLPQTMAAAAAIRRLSGLLLSLEHPHPTVDTMLGQLAEWERELRLAIPPDPAPRVGATQSASQRIYLDHASDIGAYNPCFPEYRFDHLSAAAAAGRVTFPLVHEGPPGLVHGGFLAVFFDAVVQHQNCVVGLTGKTRSLNVTYRRPTPILLELRFEILRSVGETGIESTARLILEDEVLCTAVVQTVALPPERLAGARYGKRSPKEKKGTHR
ncbi:hypothetical protein OG563_36865 [Nocardia vinacea]|uniref:Thioesterase domain-containing protein n=1 Tax=Nocardia vinacea TaxID=96468 RepID=A0ABZ1YN76_9NOCA|nr:hypothetical protein [Nocardia vinacea]